MSPAREIPMQWNFGAQDVDPTAIVGGPAQHFKGAETAYDVKLGPGVRIGPYTTVDGGTERSTLIDLGTYVMGHCNVGHDAQVGALCQIADSVVIAGHAEIGDRARIGIGALVLPYRKVGKGSRVGAGSVVTHDVPDYECWAGNPARRLYGFCREGCGIRVSDDAPHGRCPACQMSAVGSPAAMVAAVSPMLEFCKGCGVALAHDENDICDRCAWASRG